MILISDVFMWLLLSFVVSAVSHLWQFIFWQVLCFYEPKFVVLFLWELPEASSEGSLFRKTFVYASLWAPGNIQNYVERSCVSFCILIVMFSVRNMQGTHLGCIYSKEAPQTLPPPTTTRATIDTDWPLWFLYDYRTRLSKTIRERQRTRFIIHRYQRVHSMLESNTKSWVERQGGSVDLEFFLYQGSRLGCLSFPEFALFGKVKA